MTEKSIENVSIKNKVIVAETTDKSQIFRAKTSRDRSQVFGAETIPHQAETVPYQAVPESVSNTKLSQVNR